jgi:hypothetical protein
MLPPGWCAGSTNPAAAWQCPANFSRYNLEAPNLGLTWINDWVAWTGHSVRRGAAPGSSQLRVRPLTWRS